MSQSTSQKRTGGLSAQRSRRLSPEIVSVLAEGLVSARTQKELAEAVGASVSSVARWLRDPAVVSAVEQVRNETKETRVRRRVFQLVDSPDGRVALEACKIVLSNGWQKEPVEQPPAKQPEAPPGYTIVRTEPIA